MMRSVRSFVARLVSIFFLMSCPASSVAWAQVKSSSILHPAPIQTTSVALPNGIEVQAGDLRENIAVLRDDVLRIRISHTGSLPEDASWAVLASARHSSVPVTAESSGDHFGFRTRALIVELDKQTLKLTVRDLAGNILQQDARPVRFDGDAFRTYKTMPLNEHYFGLGDKTGPLDRRNGAFTLCKSIPYFMTYRAGRALGVLLDNTWRTEFDFGKESANTYSFGAADGPLDYYLFYGPSPKQVVETYAWLTGTPPLPPLWALGFQQSRYSYMSQDRVLEVAKRFRTDHIPADAIYLDIDHLDKNRPFTVNHATYPDLPKMVSELKAENFHVVAIADLSPL
jgi:alpha-glucosidase